MAIAAIAAVSGCASNTTPASNPRPGWTQWDRAIDNEARLTRAGVKRHPLTSPYSGDKIG